jgi:hypothetical protein
MSISYRGETKSISTLLTERHFEIKKDKKCHTTKHIDYLGWPDLGVPPDKA